jgi:hypothetical protein
MADDIGFINELDNSKHTPLYYALTNYDKTLALLKQGADPLLLRPSEKIKNEDVDRLLRRHTHTLISYQIQSVPLQEFYQELHGKSSLVESFHGKQADRLVEQLNQGFQVIYKVVSSIKWCRYCLKTDGAMISCNRCKVCKYCSEECKNRDWKNHRKVCALCVQKLK